MKPFILIIISVLFITPCFAQQDLLPAYPKEITYRGDIAYFNGSPFTGLLVEEKTNKRLGEYKNGYKNGMFPEYYANGTKKSEYKYANGQRDGICAEWFENKQQKSSYNYTRGNIADGKYITYLENGQIEKEETYKDGQKIIFSKYENGKLSELLELSVELYPTEQKKSEGYLKNGKKEGLWTFWYGIGGQKKSKGYYKDGNQDGQWVFWFPDGRVEYEGNYKNEMKDGQGVLHNYKEGITYKGGWKNDKKDGYGTLTWDDGFINYQGEFRNGVPDGQGTTYDKGEKVYEGEWKNGKKNGKGSYNYKLDDGAMLYHTGYFLNDTFEGQGTQNYKGIDGTTWTITGEFKNGDIFNGILYMTYSDGDKIAIEYKAGIKGKKTKIK